MYYNIGQRAVLLKGILRNQLLTMNLRKKQRLKKKIKIDFSITVTSS